MKVSTKTKYGLIFLLNLSENPSNYSQLGEIARKENISEKYLENIVSKLKATGVITVKRGAKGGYKLAIAPKDISMERILSVLETNLNFDKNGFVDTENSENSSVVKDFCTEMQTCIIDFLKSKSIQDLIDAKQIQNKNQMFYI